MNTYRFNRFNRFIRFSAICQIAGTMLLGAAFADDLQDLKDLAALNGGAYAAQRNQFLSAHPAPWDTQIGSPSDWDARLAAFILNGWQANGSLFAEWESFPLQERVIQSLYYKNPAIGAGAAGEAFLVEQLWKTAPAPPVGNDALTQLLNQGSAAPNSVWRSVFDFAPDSDLRRIALHGLANDSSAASQSALQSQISSGQNGFQMAALAGLRDSTPPYALSVLQSTQAVWEFAPSLVGLGFDALGALTSQPTARPAIHAAAADNALDVSIRIAAIGGMTNHPLPDDRTMLSTLAGGSAPPELLEYAKDSLDMYDFFEVPWPLP